MARVDLGSGLELRGIVGAPIPVYKCDTQHPNKVDSGVFRASMYCLGPQGEALCSPVFVPRVPVSCPEFLSCV